MDEAMTVNLVIAGVLVIGAIVGAKRGLWRSLTEALLVAAAILGAVLLTGKLSGPVTEWVFPKVEKRAVAWAEDLARSGAEGEAADPEALREALERFGMEPEAAEELMNAFDGTLGEAMNETVREALSGAAKPLVHALVQTVLFLLLFAVLTVVLKLLIGAVDLVMKLPVLSAVNTLGGAVFGLAAAAMILFVVLSLCARFGVALPEGTGADALRRFGTAAQGSVLAFPALIFGGK